MCKGVSQWQPLPYTAVVVTLPTPQIFLYIFEIAETFSVVLYDTWYNWGQQVQAKAPKIKT